MEAEHLQEALERGGDNIKAVFPVHLAGQCADMEKLSAIARENGLAIVEDASHAIGASYSRLEGDVAIGACADSDMAVFSFHPVKTIAMGEGGAVTTTNPDLAARVRRLRTHGMTRIQADFVHHDMAFDSAGDANPWYYEMQEVGFNYRATDIHCALGLSQLRKLDRFVQRRRELATLYDKLLQPLAPLVKPISRKPGCSPAWHLYAVLIDFVRVGFTRADLMDQLHSKGIGSQVHYIPVHRQPYYKDRYGEIDLPGADQYYHRTLSLPLFADMDEEDTERVVDALRGIFNSA